MKKSCFVICFCILLINSLTAQNYTRLWVNKFTDTTAYYHTNDMAADAAGNSYITGYFYRNNEDYYDTHLFLMKVNAAGTQVWTRYFSNALDSIDAGTAVAIDSSGYIYVTGSRVDTFCNICTVSSKISDIVTMKYDGAGNRLWLNRYHDSTYKLATPANIVVQPNGILCVVGNEKLYNFKTYQYSNKMLLQKIGANGKTVWLSKRDSAVGNAVCFDAVSNVIVGGAADSMYDYQTQKPAVFKFTAAGAYQYTKVFNQQRKNGRFYFVACDSVNDIYANGQSDTLAYYNFPQILTVKYSPSGTQRWFRKEQGHTNTMPHTYGGFAIDAAGNSYLTGQLNVSDVNDDWITTKYNSAGTRQWLKEFDGTLHAYDVPADLALDKQGNVFVTGYTYVKNGYYNYATLGYNATGVQIWVDYYSSGRNTYNFPQAIATDKAGEVLVSGGVTNGLATLKYSKKSTLVAMKEPALAGNLRMYPNPAKDNITLLYTTSLPIQSTDCFVTDMYGNVLLQKRLPVNNGTGSISFALQALHTGIYLIKVKEGTQFIAKSFLKE